MKTYDLTTPLDAYHASDRLSASKLKTFEQCGAHGFYAKHVARTSPPEPDKEALIFGQVFEDIAQGRGFDSTRYVVKDRDFRSAADKKWRDDHLAAGRSIITQSDLDSIMAMRSALEENATAIEMVRACVQQATLRMDFAGTPGLQSRPDYLSVEGCLATAYEPFTLDLKSARSLSEITSGRGVISYRYDAQAAIARECWGVWGSRHYLLVCEKSLPFRCQVVEMPTAWLDQGWRWTERQLTRLAKHYESGLWPRVEKELVTLPPPPPWADADNALNDIEDEAA
jgi:hypothetical protein